MASVWSELKRRSVVKVAVTYAVVAWLLIEVASTVLPTFNAPQWVLQTITFVIILGLPLALVFAWAFELTPDGIKREKNIERSASIVRQTGRKLNFAMIGLLVLALGYFALDGFLLQPPVPGPVLEQQSSEDDTSRPTIAVLPFQNRSSLEEDAFFVDGVHDDILTQLSKVHSISVIARTSVERFRNTKISIHEIADQLGATAVIEGGVQRAGDRVRINIQLIDATNEAHLWAESYDRKLTTTDIFATQTEIAKAVARALGAAFAEEEAVVIAESLPTANLEAWEAYQLGKHELRETSEDNYETAVRHFRRALDLDPDFALAYVGLARVALIRQYTSDAPREYALASATEAAQRALAIDSDLPEGLVVYGKLLMRRHEYGEAEGYFLRALDIDPNSTTALEAYANLLPMLGRSAEAIEPSERLVKLDPLQAEHHQSLAVSLIAVGRFRDALMRLEKALDLDPSSAFSHHEIGHILIDVGRYDLAMPWLEKSVELSEEAWWTLTFLAQAYMALDDNDEAQKLVDKALESSGGSQIGPLYVAAIFNLGRDNIDGALDLLEEAHRIDPQNVGVAATLAEIDIVNGNVDQALSRFELSIPELLDDEPVIADVDCSCISVPLAAVLLRAGQSDRAARLLDLSEIWNEGKPRLGSYGYGISDVEIHALRGDVPNALRSLREAERAGWRGWFWRYYRDFYPYVESIRNEPEFNAVFEDIERDLAQQRILIDTRPEDSQLDPDAWRIALLPET